MDKERALYLLERYHAGICTADEQAEFALLLHHPKFDELRHEMLDSLWPNEQDELNADADYVRVLSSIKGMRRPTSVRLLRQWLPYAVAIALFVVVGAWYFFDARTVVRQDEQVGLQDVTPGGNRATLTLADGTKIDLNEAQGGIVVGDGISYLDGTSVIETPEHLPKAVDYEISTPKGGTYQVTLPDGTTVWLNAGTVLRYPSRFEEGQRIVELAGEAYFDVKPLLAKNNVQTKVPFLVRTEGQTVEVLGTQFNLSAYPEDGDVRTTLVNGSVRVNATGGGGSPVILDPGQQSVLTKGLMTVKEVDIESFIAWKDGYFDFNYTPFPEMIVQIARWYDVEVVYNGVVPQETFSGRMSRKVTLQGVLKFFEGSEIKATLKGNNLIIN